MTDGDEIAVRVGEVPPCARCGGAALLRVRFGHAWTNNAGRPVHGYREADLCRACDSGDTSADGLLTLLTAARDIPLSRVADFGSHVVAWVEAVRQRGVDMDRLRGEERAHRLHGELP
ncbi:DUF6300 family protein [Streptomyces sp. M92]|uniref:DUF6300 family protein n=1 Tax=Streptomyces sp. M92 TaxID=2944250 RepID=UPI00234A0CDC|nr:DUF6300 family protein [Streptomyces sp. M92]WCN07350.1 DUF6300 family protein [Streptomyces sp. M92]